MTFDCFLKEACPTLALQWRKYRRRSARHRVLARMQKRGIEGFGDYLQLIRADPREAELLPDLMLVTVSRFFRELDCWRNLGNTVLPALLTDRSDGGSLRAWSAGCCGGEEPYSLAMVWLESISRLSPSRKMEITASDIDDASLERARMARYGRGSLREVPADILERWFRWEKASWIVADEVRSLVRFEKRNLMEGERRCSFDLVLCRYLAFTYYRGERVLAAAGRLWETLRPGGALMIGKKERMPEIATRHFEPWPGCEGFFRRREAGVTTSARGQG